MNRLDTEPQSSSGAGQRFLEAALEAAKAGVIVVERDGRIAFANQQGRALLAEGALSTLSGRRLDARELPLLRALETGRADSQLLLHESPDGARDLLLGEGNPIRDESGTVVGAVGAFADALPQDMTHLLDCAPVAVAVLRGPDLVYEYANAAFHAITPGFALIGHPFGETASDVGHIAARLKEVWATGETWRGIDVPLRIERSPEQPLDDAYFSFVCQKVRRRHPPDALLGFVVETTDRVRSHEQIDAALEATRRRAAELEAIIDTMLEGVVAYDRNRHITIINAIARRMLSRIGVKPEMLEDPAALIRSLQLAHSDGRPLTEAELPVARALAGEACRLNLRFWNPLALRYGYATIGGAPIRSDGDVVGVVSVGSDVTEATELDRLKEEFIRVIAHELKTPITIMKTYAQSLAETLGPLTLAHARMLQAIGRGADRINRIMCELLDAQQIDLGSFRLVMDTVDVRALVDELVTRVAAASPQHNVRVVASEAVTVEGDGERLREVMRILLDNAVRYSPDGGDVDVTVAREDGHARISVRDHGVGVPPDRRDRLFQRFYRAHTGTPHDYGGTGLGLYVARHIVERHGGTIAYEPAEQAGSRFTVRLPRLSGEP